jgi:hypothetical protein
MFRVPASAPVERDFADAVPETRPFALEAVPLAGDAFLVGEVPLAELALEPGASGESDPLPRRGRRGRLLTCAPPLPHSPLPHSPRPL